MASNTSDTQQKRWRVDLHSHTNHSWDGIMTPRMLVQRAQSVGLDRIAVTDHNEIEGALRARDLAPDLVIVGEEIRCECGSELIGLFLEARIPRGLPAEEVAQRIREQGGLVYAPHPFAYLTGPRERAERVLAVADICETFNGRAFLPRWNRRALAARDKRRMAAAASSDAHLPPEIGRAWTDVCAFNGPTDLLVALGDAIPCFSRPMPMWSHLITLAAGGYRSLRGVPAERTSKTIQSIGRPRS